MTSPLDMTLNYNHLNITNNKTKRLHIHILDYNNTYLVKYKMYGKCLSPFHIGRHREIRHNGRSLYLICNLLIKLVILNEKILSIALPLSV